MACCRLKLAEKGRSDFNKINLQNFTDPTNNVVGKMNVKEHDVAVGGRT